MFTSLTDWPGNFGNVQIAPMFWRIMNRETIFSVNWRSDFFQPRGIRVWLIAITVFDFARLSSGNWRCSAAAHFCDDYRGELALAWIHPYERQYTRIDKKLLVWTFRNFHREFTRARLNSRWKETFAKSALRAFSQTASSPRNREVAADRAIFSLLCTRGGQLLHQ